MIGFFDTSVHVALLHGQFSLDHVAEQVAVGRVRMSPVVASELLRGARGRARPVVERVIEGMLPIEPPSWRTSFLEAGRLLPDLFPDHEEVGLARLQNDVLLALTARHTGAVLVTLDGHFLAMQRHVPFQFVVLFG